ERAGLDVPDTHNPLVLYHVARRIGSGPGRQQFPIGAEGPASDLQSDALVVPASAVLQLPADRLAGGGIAPPGAGAFRLHHEPTVWALEEGSGHGTRPDFNRVTLGLLFLGRAHCGMTEAQAQNRGVTPSHQRYSLQHRSLLWCR